LTTKEEATLVRFLKTKKLEKIFVLSKGALEAYLPIGYKSKDMDKLIELVSKENIIDLLPSINLTEIKKIISAIQK